MALVHNGLRRITDIQSAYRAILGEDDPGFKGIERFSESLAGTLNQWQEDRVEWRILRAERTQVSRQTQAAVAAQLSLIQLQNTTTDSIIVVEQILAWASAATTMTIGIAAATGANTGQANMVADTRYTAADALSLAMLRSSNAAAVLTGQLYAERLNTANQPVRDIFGLPWVLAPLANPIGIELSTVNVQLVVSARYRIIRPSDAQLLTV